MKPRLWFVLRGKDTGTLYAAFNAAIVSERMVEAFAHLIADRGHVRVALHRETGATIKNPTLVHHGLARSARWHVVTASNNAPVADLYGIEPRTAKDVATDLATRINVPVLLLQNADRPRTIAEHAILRSDRGTLEHRPRSRSNPSSFPVVGEIWTDTRSLEKCRIVRVDRNRVTYLVVSTGNRYTLELSEFLATHKGPRRGLPGVNPKGRIRTARPRRKRVTGSRIAGRRATKTKGRRPNPKGRIASGEWVVEGVLNGTTFYESMSGAFTDIADRAMRYSTKAEAERAIPDLRRHLAIGWRAVKSAVGHYYLDSAGHHHGPFRTSGERDAHRRRHSNPRGRNPRPTTVREAIAEVIDAAKFPVVAKEVRSGKQDPVKSLEFVRRFMTTERQRAIIDQALRLARRFPGRLLDQPVANPRGRKRVLSGGPSGHHSRRRRGRIGTRTIRVTGRVKSRRPRKARPRANPRHGSQKERARAQFLKWQDRDARGHFRKMRAPKRVPTHMAALGELVEVVYESNKYDGKKKLYKHRTKRPRPVLATDPDGRDVFVVGGHMKVTPDGLVN